MLSASLYEQCYEYFRNQTNLIMAETAKEVEAYLEKLNTPQTWINLAMGALAVIPGAEMIALAGYAYGSAIIDNLKKGKGFAKSVKYTTEQVALTKYEPGKIEVTLCFGTVSIPLESKIKIGS